MEHDKDFEQQLDLDKAISESLVKCGDIDPLDHVKGWVLVIEVDRVDKGPGLMWMKGPGVTPWSARGMLADADTGYASGVGPVGI